MIVTISTVGYGEIAPKTDAGNNHISLVIIVDIILQWLMLPQTYQKSLTAS